MVGNSLSIFLMFTQGVVDPHRGMSHTLEGKVMTHQCGVPRDQCCRGGRRETGIALHFDIHSHV